MKIRFISYGYKYYEELGEKAPEHDFLFHLRDLPNPYWDLDLRDFCGLDPEIIKFFEASELTMKRLKDIQGLAKDFIQDFLSNENRQPEDQLTFAFRCTGGKHRSVYFAQSCYELFKQDTVLQALDFELEHIDLPRYSAVKS